jgi:microcystin-dependent protein
MKWLKKVAATPLTTIARVVDSLSATTNDRTNAPSIHAVREAVNNNWLSIYPVGSIYMSVNNVNPSELFGGTWQQIKDTFLLASGDVYNNGATGGEATHTLSASEIPTHTHSYEQAVRAHGHELLVEEMPTHSHYTQISQDVFCYENGGYFRQSDGTQASDIKIAATDISAYTSEVGSGVAHEHTIDTQTANSGSEGQGGAHNNMPPYLAVNVWERTA